MPITNFWSTSPSLSSATLGALPAGTADLNIAPADLSPDKFRTWSLKSQADYINKYGSVPIGSTGTQKSVTVGSGAAATAFSVAATNTLGLKVERFNTVGGATVSSQDFTPGNIGRDASDAELATPPGQLDYKTFLQWNRADQLSYVEANRGAQASLTIGLPSSGMRIVADVLPDIVAGAGVIQHTAGDYEPIPYQHLSGTTNGMPSAIVKASADALFPALNGVDVSLAVEDRPEKFYQTLSDLGSLTAAETAAGLTLDGKKKAFLDDFAKWHTGYQLEWVKKNGTGSTPPQVDIALSDGSRLTALVSKSDATKLIIAQSLDKAAFARLTEDEQLQVAGSPAFATMKKLLGLELNGAANVSDVANPGGAAVTATKAVENLIDYVNRQTTSNNPFTVVTTVRDDASTVPSLPVLGELKDKQGNLVYKEEWRQLDPSKLKIENAFPLRLSTEWSVVRVYTRMPEEDRSAFIRQMDLLKTQLSGMGVVSAQDIARQLNELKTRFDRAFAFFDTRPPTKLLEAMGIPANTNVTTYSGLVSSTGDISGIQNGYKIFIAQEMRIAELAEARMDIARGTTGLGKTLDAPSLVYRLQSLYNLAGEAHVVMETEEINQQNALLKSYAAMQDIVNRTLQKFAKAGEGNSRILGLANSDDAPSISTTDMYAIAMFEDFLGSQKHPLERLSSKTFERPRTDTFLQNAGKNDNYDLNEKSNNDWSIYASRLSETVTVLNQNSQLKMNDVNSLDKERNRHYELANSALSKMNDMIQSIARS